MSKLVIFGIIFAFLHLAATLSLMCDKIEANYKPNEYIDSIIPELKNPGTKSASIHSVTKIIKEIPIDSEIILKAEHLVGDKFEELGVPYKFNVCKFLSEDKHLAPHVTKFGNFSTKCPYKPGTYVINDMKLSEIEKLPFEFDPGTYKLFFTAKIAGEFFETVLSCRA